jgi:peroxiredoxin
MQRVWILPLTAVVIAGLCAWRMTLPPRPVVESQTATRRPAPRAGFLLVDQHSHPVKLERYVGRQAVLVRFTGTAAADTDPVLLWLRDHAEAAAQAGYEVIGVTAEPPSAVRANARHAGQEWPFPVVSDIVIGEPAPTPLHALWGRVDTETGAPQSGLFEIDRAGTVAFDGPKPQAIEDPLAWLQRIAVP